MATLNLADFSDALSLVFRARMQNQINRNVVLLNLLEIKSGEGKVMDWTAKFTGRSDGAGYSEGADMLDADFDSEVREDAILSWAQYRKGAKVSGLAQAANATNYNPISADDVSGTDIFEGEIHDGVRRLALGIGKNLYDGVGSTAKPIIGLETAILDSGTYATIDSSVRTEHKSTVTSLAKALLSFSELRKFHTGIYNACGLPPEFVITDTATFDAIGDLFGDERRWVDEIHTAGRGLIKLRGGFKALEVDGIPYLRDRFCTTDTLYGLNSEWVHIEQLPGFVSPMSYERFAAIMDSITSERPPMEEYGELEATNSGLVPYVDMIARTGDAQKAQIKSYLQLGVTRRNGHGRLNLT